MPLTLPDFPPVAGQKAKASQVIGWLAATIAKFAGGITTLDVSSTAGITGSQLSSSSGTRITQANLEDQAVTNRVLKLDATAGSATAAVKRDNIVDREVIQAKVALASLSQAEMKITVASKALSGVISDGSPATFAGSSFSPALPTLATILPVSWWLEGPSISFVAWLAFDVKASDKTVGFIAYMTSAGSIDLGASGYTLKFAYLNIT